MAEITGTMEWILENIAGLAIVIFEFIGVAIIIWSGITGFLKWLKHDSNTGVYLARGLAMGLEFKMGSEILRTVVVREWKEIGIVAGNHSPACGADLPSSLGNQGRGKKQRTQVILIR